MNREQASKQQKTVPQQKIASENNTQLNPAIQLNTIQKKEYSKTILEGKSTIDNISLNPLFMDAEFIPLSLVTQDEIDTFFQMATTTATFATSEEINLDKLIKAYPLPDFTSNAADDKASAADDDLLNLLDDAEINEVLENSDTIELSIFSI